MKFYAANFTTLHNIILKCVGHKNGCSEVQERKFLKIDGQIKWGWRSFVFEILSKLNAINSCNVSIKSSWLPQPANTSEGGHSRWVVAWGVMTMRVVSTSRHHLCVPDDVANNRIEEETIMTCNSLEMEFCMPCKAIDSSSIGSLTSQRLPRLVLPRYLSPMPCCTTTTTYLFQHNS